MTLRLPNVSDVKPSILGLGYVGLPLAAALSRRYPTIGFDLNQDRIAQLESGLDVTLELDRVELGALTGLRFTSNVDDLLVANLHIVTVPTPVDRYKRPDLTALREASRMVGRVIKQGDGVVFESTVYPGATEEVCLPIIAGESGLTLNEDFYAGYSPERINPGDKTHRITHITKVTSGSTREAAKLIDAVYSSVIEAGTHCAPSIRVAEAAKVIENTQRDLNIALINELAMIFDRLGIDTRDVLAAASTKWNFLPFEPGLVGGHCIGVDPYYLTFKAQEIGHHPEVILSGRRINDAMGEYVADRVVKLMTRRRIHIVDARVLVMGLAFKENCPDIRNTRVVDLLTGLQEYHVSVDVYDPWVEGRVAQDEYGISLIESLEPGAYDAVVVAVGHRQFEELGLDGIRALGRDPCVMFDLKGVLPATPDISRL